MPTYKELLDSKEWKQKRALIIERDKLICQHCHNANLLSTCEVKHGLRLDIQNNAFLLYYLFPLQHNASLKSLAKKIYGSNREQCFLKIDSLYSKNRIKHTLVYYEKQDTTIIKPLAVRTFINSEYKWYLDFPIISNLVPAINIKEEWIYNTTLHVHHTYYKYDLLPWEYPDASLVTLCWFCHENLHKNEKIPVLDEHGNEIQKYTPCPRCYGAGVFPEFHHVYDGICFQCDGAKYLELM